MLLVLVGSVADFAEPMDEHRARQAVAGFALVEFLAGRRAAAPGRLIQSSVNSVRSSRPSSRRAAATPFCRGYGGELAHDQRCRHACRCGWKRRRGGSPTNGRG